LLVSVPKHCNSRDENATNKAGECPTKWERQLANRRQSEREARWTA
jgi:hypothetical protein